jgi:hypothetical protein
MITLKPATSRLPVRTASVAFAALLALGLPLAAQSRGHGGGGGSAHSSGGGGSHSSSGGGHSSGGSGSHSGGSHSGGRTAHGVPGGGSSAGGQRQSGHGGFHGGHNGGGHGGFRGGHSYYYPFGWGFGFWPGYYWDGWYGDPYYAPYYREGYGSYGDDERESGALDLDVSPGRTHVFVNGEDLGIVDRYDGWPGYLWLPEGTYDVAFYLPGYKTIARQITIYPGSVIDIDDRLEKGDAVRPEDLISKSHVRRDDRLRFERERQERIDRQNGDDEDQDWRDRVRHDRGMRNRDDDQGDDDHHDGRMDGRPDGRMDGRDSGGAHLRLSVEPQDASVYLDGQFVGTGSDLSLLHAGLQVAPGHHKLAIVRPGHKAVEKDFDAKAGGNVALEISLEAGSGM